MSASEFQIAPHLERALEAMSKDLSIDPQALVNQAVFAWLRINGYVAPSAASVAVAHAEALAPTVEKKVPAVTGEMSAFVPSKPPGAAALGGERKSEPALDAVEPVVAKKKSEPALEPVVPEPEPAPAPAKKKSEPALDPVAAKKKSEPALEPVAAKKKSEPSLEPASEPEPAVVVSPSAQSVPAVADAPVSSPSGGQLAAMARMKEIAAELDKLTKPWPDWVASEEEEEEEEDEQDDDSDQDEPEEEEREETGDHSAGASTSDEVDKPEPRDPFEADLPPEVSTGENELQEPPPDEEPVGESTVVLRSVPIVLYLEREGADPVRVDSERFIIGRGPTCDLVIDSPRVSREHVAITRSGIRYFLKDLNSSNGTWMGEERIAERELESGDVILLGNEAVTFILRGE